MPLAVSGYRELLRADARASKETKLGVRPALREVAEPVRRTAEQRAGSQIRNMTPAWAGMRVGITQRIVYVAPKQRGARKRSLARQRRPNLAPLLMGRAMEPALAENAHVLERRLEAMLDSVGRHWAAGG